MFTHDNTHQKVVSLEVPAAEFPQDGLVRHYTLEVSPAFAHSRPDVDVFVLANRESAGCGDLDEDSSWADVNGAVMPEGVFAPGTVTAVPAGGLPMSGVRKGIQVLGEEPSFTVPTVKLVRTVSKLRYVFCQMENEDGEGEQVSISSIVLNGGLLGKEEYLFTEGQHALVRHDDPDLSYVQLPFTATGPGTDICSNPKPENLVFSGQDPVTYEEMLQDAIDSHLLTDCGTFYLKETDKQLRGWVNYAVGDKQNSREFLMDVPGDFARNRTWILYGYFISGRNLQLGLTVLPWDKNNYTIDFTEQSVMIIEPGFRVDSEENRNAATITKTGSEGRVDLWDVHLKTGKTVVGKIQITAPVGGTFIIVPEHYTEAFTVEPSAPVTINPNLDGGVITVSIYKNNDYTESTTGKFITLGFHVETTDGREIDVESEMSNRYTFYLP